MLDGALEHRDSMGNGSVIRPGDVQRMSAGTGVVHSEYNASHASPCTSSRSGSCPSGAGSRPATSRSASPTTSARGALAPGGVARRARRLGHDAPGRRLYAGAARRPATRRHELAPGRHAWVQVARGAVRVNGERLDAGDGAALEDEARASRSRRAGRRGAALRPGVSDRGSSGQDISEPSSFAVRPRHRASTTEPRRSAPAPATPATTGAPSTSSSSRAAVPRSGEPARATGRRRRSSAPGGGARRRWAWVRRRAA